ncbi:MAG: aminomethyl transferase family protein [Ignavibacteriae bacterium]|nr:aminomethyl transferase family protein [Ignavibacteriota bacterium]NOG96666.1 aminomethyl transferase family protein [Ignavibacteriota bacterium]
MEAKVDYKYKLTEYLRNKFPNSVLSESGSFEKYTDVEEEYNALRYGVGIRDLSDSTNLKISGNDSLDFLHRISTNSVKDINEYELVKTLFTNDKGRIIDRVLMLRLSNYCLLVGSYNEENKLQRWLDRYVIMEDINIENLTGRYLILELTGKQVDSYLTLICGKAIEDLDYDKIILEQLEDTTFYLFKSKNYNGENKYWILAYIEDAENLIESLSNNKSVFDMAFVGSKAYETYRVEKGIPVYPNELNDDFNPHELNLLSEVDFNKGCYIGQEVIARLETYDKVQKKLTAVELENGLLTEHKLKLFNSNKEEVGSLTSIANSVIRNKNVGLAVIRKKYREEGTELNVIDSENNTYTVKVIKLPITK